MEKSARIYAISKLTLYLHMLGIAQGRLQSVYGGVLPGFEPFRP